MYQLVFVLVPSGVADVDGYVRDALKHHEERFDRWRYGGTHDGRILPEASPRGRPGTWQNNSCPVEQVAVVPAALIDPSLEWHDCGQFGNVLTKPFSEADWALWEQYARAVFSEFTDAVAVAVEAHS